MRAIGILIFCFLTFGLYSQTTIDFSEDKDNNLYIKLYGHIDYNQKIESGKRHAGNLDVHRLVTLIGYQFNRKTQFISEIEFEHVKEVFVEQAFVKHRISKGINLRAGLLLIPMGLVNEAHEPTFFYSVERPLVDKIIIPSTWREVGFGISGLFPKHSLRYQLYLVNNPISYDNGAKINAANGFRSGRQKGAESILTSFPGISGQLEYFGFSDAKIGLSAYHGISNTSLYGEYEVIDALSSDIIDSSRVYITMATLHSTYDPGSWTLRFQYSVTRFGNTTEYNEFTGSNTPELSHGLYALVAYDFLNKENLTLAPFIRYSHINSNLRLARGHEQDASLKQNIWTVGLNYKPNPAVVFKMDYQFYARDSGSDYNQFNTGVGVWF